MTSSRIRRWALTGTTLVAAAIGGTVAMSGTAGAATLHDAAVKPLTLAPSCISFTQYQHGNAITGYYTNVYLDNNCGANERVKIIMRNGYDSGCLQMTPGLLNKEFTSSSDNGLRPTVDRLDAC